VVVQHHAPVALPPERPGTHCIGGWVGPRAGAENLISIEIRYLDRPARSESLYRLSYPAPCNFYCICIIYKCDHWLHNTTRRVACGPRVTGW